MHFDFLPGWPLHAAPSLWLAAMLIVAVLVGELFARTSWLSRMTGYIATGLVMGPGALALAVQSPITEWRVVIELALGILLFELGMRINLRWLARNRWLFISSLLESGLSFASVFLLLQFFGASAVIAGTAAAIAVATSPAVVVRVVAELGAQGQVTDRLMLHTSLNSIYAAVAVDVMVGMMHHEFRGAAFEAVLYSVYLLCGAVLVGAGFGIAFRRIERWLGDRGEVLSFLLLGMIGLAVSISATLKVPALLSMLLAGVIVRNISRRPLIHPPHFGSAGAVLIILMFVLNGMSIAPQQILQGAGVGLALVLVRLLAKLTGVFVIARPSGASWKQALALGVALTPMSTIALLLTLDTARLFPEFGAAVQSTLVGGILVLELAGAVMTHAAIKLAGESRA